MKVLITNAIRELRTLRFTYDTRSRITAEPYALGVTDDKREAVLCWQVSPPIVQGEPWRLYYLDRIAGLQMLDRPMELPPEGRQPPMEKFSSTYEMLQAPGSLA